MAQAQGSSGRILLLEESTWGTTPSVTPGDSCVLPFESEGLSASQPRQQNPHITSGRDYSKGSLGRVDCGGDLGFALNPLAHGWIWKALLGTAAVTGTDPYTHTWTVPSASPPSFSIEKGFTDITQYLVYTGMKLGSLNFKMTPEGFLMCTAGWLGKNASASGASYDSSPTSYSDLPFELTAANVSISEGGSALGTALELDVTIDNEPDGDNYTLANQGARGALPLNKCRISGTLKAHFENLTLYNKALNGTESSLAMVLRHGTGAGSAGNEQCTVTIPEIVYGRADPQITGAGGVVWEGPFEAFYDNATEASSLEVELKNAIASY